MDALMLLRARAPSTDGASANNPTQEPMEAIVGSTVLMGASLVLIVLRFWARIRGTSPRGRHGVWWDDWTALFAFIFFVPAYMMIVAFFAPHLGVHIDTFSEQDKRKGDNALRAFILFFAYNMAFARCSALLFCHRVFITGDKSRYRYLLGSLQGLNLFGALLTLSLHTFSCRITDDPESGPEGQCLPGSLVLLIASIGSFTCDFLILLAPLPMVLRLQVGSGGTRWLVAAPFLCGLFVVTVSLGRVIVTATKGAMLDQDITFYGLELLWWPVAEMAAGLMSICLPSIYGLLRQSIDRKRHSHDLSQPKSLSPSSSNASPVQYAHHPMVEAGHAIPQPNLNDSSSDASRSTASTSEKNQTSPVPSNFRLNRTSTVPRSIYMPAQIEDYRGRVLRLNSNTHPALQALEQCERYP